MGMTGISKSQVSRLCEEIDGTAMPQRIQMIERIDRLLTADDETIFLDDLFVQAMPSDDGTEPGRTQRAQRSVAVAAAGRARGAARAERRRDPPAPERRMRMRRPLAAATATAQPTYRSHTP